jgi:excinuclease ABC subunit B
MFQLQSDFSPQGDQPKAIEQICQKFRHDEHMLTLLGATGTGKTFTMANVIQELSKPTLILSHNKTLAAQLATEFKYFFPDNAVHYFVSYFDYYQPESYLPERDIYIEKEATINKEIEMYRLSTMASLLSREDVIVVSSVSALYGLGSSEFFEKNRLYLEVGQQYEFEQIKSQLIGMQYRPITTSMEQGMFEVRGEIVDIYASTEKVLYRLIFNDTTLEMIQAKDALTFKEIGKRDRATIRPATQYLQDMREVDEILAAIEQEMETRAAWFEKHDFLVEAQRLRKKVSYDTKMIKETGFVNGIENYSPYFEDRLDGAPPNTLFDYFPDDMLLIVDESHMTVPQLGAMPRGDASRKQTLVDHGFRLPTAVHHRPINFDELQGLLGWQPLSSLDVHPAVTDKYKEQARSLFVSATPAEYEIHHSSSVVQQIIRPTGLLDPLTYVYPKSGSYQSLLDSVDQLGEHQALLRHDYQQVDEEELIF